MNSGMIDKKRPEYITWDVNIANLTLNADTFTNCVGNGIEDFCQVAANLSLNIDGSLQPGPGRHSECAAARFSKAFSMGMPTASPAQPCGIRRDRGREFSADCLHGLHGRVSCPQTIDHQVEHVWKLVIEGVNRWLCRRHLSTGLASY